MAGAGRVDRGQEILLAEGFDEVAEDAGLDRARDELVLAVGRQHHDRDRALVENAARGLDPVEPGHLHVEHGDVGLGRPCKLHRLLPVPRLGTHLVARPFEERLQIEADDRLVLGDEDPRHAGKTTSARRPPFE